MSKPLDFTKVVNVTCQDAELSGANLFDFNNAMFGVIQLLP